MGFMDTLALPPEMTRLDQWLVWKEEGRKGDTTKVPLSPHTGYKSPANEEKTWSSYEKAAQVAADNGWGLGFVFTADDNLVGVDLDHMRDAETGDIDTIASDIITKLDSYTEISPSGTGFHIIVSGQLPRGKNRKGPIEMYEEDRFFTVTGNRLPGTEPTVKAREGQIRVIHHKHLKAEEEDKKKKPDTTQPKISLDDHDILRKAKNSNSGQKFEALWNGMIGGYESQSEADLALASYLAFWTGGDAGQMDRLFRQSGLMRDKWEKEHSSQGKTYGEMTVQKAINTSTSFYTGSK